jgi:hypothetical protein
LQQIRNYYAREQCKFAEFIERKFRRERVTNLCQCERIKSFSPEQLAADFAPKQITAFIYGEREKEREREAADRQLCEAVEAEEVLSGALLFHPLSLSLSPLLHY